MILGIRQADLSDNRDDKYTAGVDHVSGIVPFVNSFRTHPLGSMMRDGKMNLQHRRATRRRSSTHTRPPRLR